MDISVSINGESRQLDAGTTIADLIAELGLEGRRLAVEVNGDVVPRSTHATAALAAGDRVEIVQAIGGG